ncbi:hypothetical protein ASD11_12490 [Aeromicrobium sp. Root495]|nr:hypothetical protein ASD11_12490 [Aeromicrobium sp. Root495]
MGVLVAATLVAGLSGCGTDDVSVGPTRLSDAQLPDAASVRTVRPDVSRTTWAAMHLSTHERALDACDGPVAVDIGPGRPTLVVEHDYCGGKEWIAPLRRGDVVQLDGVGVRPGLYRVTGRTMLTRGKARVRDLPPGQLVLQTCVSPTKQVEVSAVMVQDAVAS